MRRILFFIVMTALLSGCATLQSSGLPTEGTVSVPGRPKVPAVFVDGKLYRPAGVSSELSNIQEKQLESYIQKRGIVFAKVTLGGVLQSRDVKLVIERQGNAGERFLLPVGERFWETASHDEARPKGEGYFFVELSAGKYAITSLVTVVGSTTAEESVAIFFEVIPDSIIYLGTVRIVGTKERIRLGGVPVIKPGFDYTLNVVDERHDGIAAFLKRYPHFSADILVRLMQVGRSVPR